MSKIIEAQIETGQPYMLYKDSINNKSNQKNIGVIKSSNLCAEIVEYSDKSETSVCNLASIALPKFVKRSKNKKNKEYDFKALYKTAKLATKNLDEVIDINFYPTEKTETSNNKHRPIGLGIQGLAEVFFELEIMNLDDKTSKKYLNDNNVSYWKPWLRKIFQRKNALYSREEIWVFCFQTLI